MDKPILGPHPDRHEYSPEIAYKILEDWQVYVIEHPDEVDRLDPLGFCPSASDKPHANYPSVHVIEFSAKRTETIKFYILDCEVCHGWAFGCWDDEDFYIFPQGTPFYYLVNVDIEEQLGENE